MKDAHHKEKISFRFMNFSSQLLPLLREVLPGVKLKTKKRQVAGGLVVAFELEEKRNYEKLFAFIREQKISQASFGVWISLVTECDSDGVHVPEFVIAIIREIGGQVDFSFTCV
jgi:hypothetical protein